MIFPAEVYVLIVLILKDATGLSENVLSGQYLPVVMSTGTFQTLSVLKPLLICQLTLLSIIKISLPVYHAR